MKLDPQREAGASFVTRRPVAITMLVLALAVFGGVSFSKLSIDLLPEISYPTLTVRTTWAGAAPEDVEERISEKVQEALSTLDDLVRSTSISRAGASDVILDFDWGTPMTFAVQDVREKLDGVFLPVGVERPLILRYDPNLDPILRIGIRAPEGREARTEEEREAELIQLRWLAENRLKRELETMEGVAAVQVHGGLEEEIRVRLDPYQLAARRIDPADLARRLEQENINASGGSLLEGSAEYLVRTVNQFRSLAEIEALPIARRGDAVLRVRDVGRVARTYVKREVISRLDGSESVELDVYREAGANIVQLAARVNEKLFGDADQQASAAKMAQGEGPTTLEEREDVDFLAWRYKDDLRMEVLSDQSVFIRDAIDDVKNAALVGALLSVVVIWVFLRRMSATLIIGLSIPISIVVTFAPMFLADVSLNIMSLGGLALGVGMLVDNAIVVLESITRCREEGDGLARAATRGVSEVAGAVTASTLTTISVFAPIVFVTGIAGQIFGDQALTVVSALLVSLLVAVLFIPMLASRTWLAGEAAELAAEEDGDPSLWRPVRWSAGKLIGACALALLLLVLIPPVALVTDDAGVLAPKAGLQTGIDAVLLLLGLLAVVVMPRSGLRKASREWVLVPWAGLQWTWWETLPNLLRILFRVYLLRLAAVALLGVAVGRLLALIGWVVTWPVRAAFEVVWGAIEAAYPRALSAALAAPWLVVLASGGLFWAALQRFPNLGVELLPEIHQGEFTAHAKLHIGSPLSETDRVMSELDRAVRALPDVETTALSVGVERETLTREIEGSHTARLTVRMKAEARNPARERALEAEVRRLLTRHPAMRSVEITRPTPFAIESPVAVEVKGYDLPKLEQVAAEVVRRLEAVPGLADVRSTVRPGHPEARITFDREKTLELGLDLAQVSTLVRDQVLGNVSTRFHEGDERIDIRVIGDEAVLDTLEAVLDLPVNPSAEQPVSLRTVADITTVQGPAEIRRIGNTRAVVISAASTGVDLGGLSKRIQRALGSLRPPPDVTVELGGQKREMDEAQESMRFALLLAVFLVYVVMASQFESLLQPFIILLTVPLAGVGVIFALEFLTVPLSVVVFIGLIMLAGIVVNNAIVLVDRINQQRAGGRDVRAAVLEAGRARLRPILMTTATTVLGLLPLTGWLAGIPIIGALGAGEGAEIRAPMAITVITGLVSSTLLTLLVIPSVYSLLYRRRRGAAAGPQEAA